VTPALLVLALQAAPVGPPPTLPATPAPATPAPAVTTPAVTTPAVTTPAEPVVPPAPPATPATPATYNYPSSAAPTIPSPTTPYNYPPLPTTFAKTQDELKFRRIVFANLYTLNFGVLYPIPSADFQFFLGTNLRPRKRLLGGQWNTAIGYQLTLSVGTADYSTLAIGDWDPYQNNDIDLYFIPIFFHRHHITAMGHGGARGRLFYSFGGGAFMWATQLVGVEAEGKLGYVFTRDLDRRVKGVMGGQARLGGVLGGVPLPQFGLFIGFMVF
jgi:hypothetical protein